MSRGYDLREGWETATKRAAVIAPLAARDGRLSPSVVEDAAAALGVCRSLVYRLIAKYRENPVIDSLVPARRGRKQASRALHPRVEELVAEAIARAERNSGGARAGLPQRQRLRRIMLELETRCTGEDLRCPDRRSVEKRLAAAAAE